MENNIVHTHEPQGGKTEDIQKSSNEIPYCIKGKGRGNRGYKKKVIGSEVWNCGSN